MCGGERGGEKTTGYGATAGATRDSAHRGAARCSRLRRHASPRGLGQRTWLSEQEVGINR